MRRRHRPPGAVDDTAKLEEHVYLLEAGPTGEGPSATVISNATGCSSVYASTMPFNPYRDPWVNSLFQDAQPLAKGLFEGIASGAVDTVRALRVARLELEDAYDAEQHDRELEMLDWTGFTQRERTLLPTFLTVGGDGATYDIGFGALSRILTSRTPIKVMVLNTGGYSNTGGQASTSSFVAQDSDLARFGAEAEGKTEPRKELALLASFHPEVLVVQSVTAMQAHFLSNVAEFLEYGEARRCSTCTRRASPARDLRRAGGQRGRLAVRTRVYPLFVHDPRAGESERPVHLAGLEPWRPVGL